MKKIKGFLSAFAVIVIVSSALAFRPYTSGSVYCSSTCAASKLVAFKIDPTGSTTSPCTVGVTPYSYCADGTCTATVLGTTKFKSTTDVAQ
jgi:hypothetical protein